MTKRIVNIPGAPRSPFYSQAVVAGSTVYVSGTVGIDPATGRLAGATIEAQTHQALANAATILAAVGATLEDVVDVLVLLARPTDFDDFNAAYAQVFGRDPPARAVAKLGVDLPGVLVSIRLTAVRGD